MRVQQAAISAPPIRIEGGSHRAMLTTRRRKHITARPHILALPPCFSVISAIDAAGQAGRTIAL